MSAGAFASCLDEDGREARPAARIAVEAIAVESGLKPAARFTISRRAAESLCGMLHSAGLRTEVYTPDPEEWGYRRATEAERLQASARDVRVYFAKDEAALGRAMQAQRAQDDPALGMALGYPECCIAANELFGRLQMTDMVRVARCRGAHDWRLNIFLTEFEVGQGSPYYLVSHFPCSLDCRASIAYADALFAVLQRRVPRFAAALRDLLRYPVLLRDERDPPEERRHGNFGGLLLGAAVGDFVSFQGWRPLRVGDLLPEARLDQADTVLDTGEHLVVMHAATQRVLAQLGSERWRLVGF